MHIVVFLQTISVRIAQQLDEFSQDAEFRALSIHDRQ
jgi:hypothetical protein